VPAADDNWFALTASELPVADAYAWAVLPRCGAVVLFSGTARDHAEGRPGVTRLAYEAYEEHVLDRFAVLADEVRARWPEVGRIGVLHRVGDVAIGESSVIVVVSAPHRGEAFDAARYAIDALKATVPIWKKEAWEGGDDWALGAKDVTSTKDLAASPEAAR
jgi:molybdopterin synthase catalytic subunit